jgi:hypothetical protein
MMETKYGIPLKEWEELKSFARDFLINEAKSENVVFYYDFKSKLEEQGYGIVHWALGHILGEISKEEDEKGHGMLSALVIGKDSNMPGKGFFVLAKGLGKSFIDDMTFWQEELKKVYAAWHE